MTIEEIFLAMLTLCSACLGWFARELYQAIETLKRDLNKLEVKIGTDFVRYDRLQDMLAPVIKGIDEIKAALGHKVDKP